MNLRPCIDIHNGKVKQIIGSSLKDEGDRAAENFVSEKGAAYFAGLFRSYGLKGGHVIMLNPPSSPFYEATKNEALSALGEWPGGFMAGGGITPENAGEFLDAGASHVIVTSYIFDGPALSYEKLDELVSVCGKERLVLDLSCRKRPVRGAKGSEPGDSAHSAFTDGYYVVTDRWQTYTDLKVDEALLDSLSAYCDEFLIHGVDAEGKRQGVDPGLLQIISSSPVPVTYAGGVSSFEHLDTVKAVGKGQIDVTIGSALSVFGGGMSLDDAVRYFD